MYSQLLGGKYISSKLIALRKLLSLNLSFLGGSKMEILHTWAQKHLEGGKERKIQH